MFKRAQGLALLLSFSCVFSLNAVKWDWNKINLDQELMNFKVPKGFLWSASSAAYQIYGAKGCPDSNWANFEKTHPQIIEEPSGCGCGTFGNHDADIACIEELGLNAYRFSVDWSLIEPQQGKLNRQVLEDYKIFCQKLAAKGVQPIVALYHQVHPQWFAELGGFEKEENLHHLVEFCKLVFTELQPYVKMWTVAAEPTTTILQCYMRGVCPPGKSGFGNFKLAGEVLKNLLLAQVHVYQALKQLPGGSQAQIGIAHGVLHATPYYWFNPIARITASYLDHMLNTTVMQFFKTGLFEYKMPRAYIRYECPEAVNAFDFFGVDYYSRIVVGTMGEAYAPDDIKTDMPYAFYPEGLYEAIEEVAVFKKPIYILENGIADAKDDRRSLWIQRHMYALKKALEAGYDVRGFSYWSLTDNWEWGTTKYRFGLFEVDFKTLSRKLRQGSKMYQWIVKHTLGKL